MNAGTRIRWWAALLVFGVAMGALEGIVVIYLRALYYPDGFTFPLAPMPRAIYLAELAREACTLLMLGGLAALAARGFLRQFALFLWSFAIWDIAYYAALKVALDWPASWLEWDILFLIPLPWVGPVLAPVLYCTAMCAVGAASWRLADSGLRMRRADVLWIAASAALVLWTFMEEPLQLVARVVAAEPDRALHTEAATRAFHTYVPLRFNWPIFLGGLVAGHLAALRMLRQSRGAIRRPEGISAPSTQAPS
ncbi:MAG TPA: hypothetical protein PKE12_02575 [Kiritimatiellia bacterium]|nr:hypothetical protein [Kiritimatiellia bacterium]